MIFFAVAAALAVIVLVAGLVIVARPAEDRARGSARAGTVPADSGVAPVSYSSSPSTAAYAAIAQRTADPAALNPVELFSGPAAAITARDGSRVRLTLRARQLDADCSRAVWGAAAGAELRRGGCSQAARAGYVDTKTNRYALTVAVFNLAGVRDADRVVAALGEGRGAGFVLPAAGPPPLDRFGQGYSMARGLGMGHYAVIAWAQRLDGRAAATTSSAELLALLIEGGKVPAVLARAAAGP